MRLYRWIYRRDRHTGDVARRAIWFWRSVAVAALAIGSVGCADLAAIRDYGHISADAVRYKGIVQDYVAAPERRALYAPSGACDTCKQQAAEHKDQEAGLLLEQVTLQAYMDSLAKLAADDVVDYSKEYGDLNSAIVAAKFSTQAQADALTQIANVLTKASTDAWRRKKLKELIEGTNASIQEVVAGLQTVMRAFKLEEDIEETAMTAYYQGLIKQSRDPAGIDAAQEWSRLHASDIQARRDAITAYEEVLTKIGAGHQQLYDHRNDLASKANLEAMKAYAGELKKAYKALQDLRS